MPFPLRRGCRHCLSPVFDPTHGPQEGKTGLGQLEAGFNLTHMFEDRGLADPEVAAFESLMPLYIATRAVKR